MRANGLLPYEIVEEPTSCEMTGHSGLLPYIDLACVLGVLKESDEKIGICGEQGWMDRHHVLSFVLLNLAGGGCVEDIRMLEADQGLCRIFRQAEKYGLGKAERRGLDARFRKGRERTFPSETRLYEYLNEFHNSFEEKKRAEGKAFIPEKNEHLLGLCEVNTALVAGVQRHRPQREATLDIDATLAETNKKEALYCYDGYRAYQPLSVYWAETSLVVLSEFRDGNVPAGYDMLRIVKESIAALPGGVEKIRLRMDSAGYQHDVLRFCATGDELIRWHYARCGKSEEAHAVMKSDLAGGTFPSGKFGANAAWWAMMVLAHAAMRLLALPEGMKNKRLKGIRFALIDVPGRVVEHARQMYVRLARGHPALEWLNEMRRAIRGLSPSFA